MIMSIISKSLKKQTLNIILSILVDLIFLAVVFVWNKYLANLIDFVVAGNKMTAQMIWAFVIILVVFVMSNGASTFISNYTCEQINYHIRRLYIEESAKKDYEYFCNIGAGQGSSFLLNELNAVCNFISTNLFFIFDSAVKFLGTFGWFLILNPKLAVLSNFPVAAILVYVTFTSKILKKYTVCANEEKSKLNGMTESLMNLFPVIRLYDANKMILKKYGDANMTWEKLVTNMEKKKAVLMSLSALMTCIPLLLTILIGGKQIIDARMTIGELYIFINLSGNVSGILMNMPAFIMQLRVFMGNVEKIK